MPWTDDEWDGFCALVDESWPGKFDDKAAQAWLILLDGVEPQAAVTALRRLLYEGHRFRPSASEFFASLRSDPSRPTFAEAFRLIFGPGGALAAEAPPGAYPTLTHRARAKRAAIDERVEGMHPLVGAFIRAQGVERLRGLGVNDPEYGEVRRRDLEREWNVFVEANDGREVAALTSGRDDVAGELRRLDPLAMLPGGMRPRPELGAGG
jgi:hypothetical protein